MLILTLIIGSVFSLGCGGVDEVRLLLGKVKAQEERIIGYEVKLDEVLSGAQAKEAEYIATFDVNGDGKVDKDEFLSNKTGVTAMLMNSFKGGWKEILSTLALFLFTFFGLHGANPREKLRQYGSKGMLGWVFRLAGAFGKQPKPPNT